MTDILDTLEKYAAEDLGCGNYAFMEVFKEAADEIKYLRSLAGSMGHQIECPPVPKSVDPSGW